MRRPWGTDGGLAVTQFSDDPGRLAPGARVFLDGDRAANVVARRQAGSAVVLGLDTVRSLRDADALRGTIIEMERDDLPPQPEGVYYHYEIVGCSVRTTDGEELGVVSEILDTGANDVYVVSGAPGSDELLVPAISGVVIGVDVEARRITVDLPEGLR